MPALPSGTVTFLFTDIEGSTRLWEQYPEAMRAAVARHDALLRACVEENHGALVKTTGDGLLAVFADAADAVAALVAGQRALLAEAWGESGPLRVRMALHTGNAELRGGDYFGPAVNRAARLMVLAHGGQMLLSGTTADLVRERLQPELTLRELGEQRLKDLAQPERVAQLVAPGLPADFPPLNPFNACPNNLPVQLTSFVGREREIAEIKRLLATTRLLTLTGPGGTGKTRLSLQVAAEICADGPAALPMPWDRPLAGRADARSQGAAQLEAASRLAAGSPPTALPRAQLEAASRLAPDSEGAESGRMKAEGGRMRADHADAATWAGARPAPTSWSAGVWLVELAPLSDPALLPQRIAALFSLREQPGRSMLEVLGDYLRAKQMLLLLDNCEHLIEACAQVADMLLRTCTRLTIMASSREALGIAGETAYRVPSLSCPTLRDVAAGLAPGQAGQDAGAALPLEAYDAIRLFAARAGAVQPHFALTAQNAPAVAQICQRLDGIPLAIELATARMKLFSAEQIAARLDDRFRLLTGGSRTALPRQQTLQALIDWSYDLLSEPERMLLRRLSVFAGGWSFEAAEEVTSNQLARGSEQGASDFSSEVPHLPLATSDLPRIDVLDLLSQLVNKSLVAVDEEQSADGSVRYNFLETVRQYARDKLLASGESAQVRDRQLAWFLRFAEAAAPHLSGREMLAWQRRLDVEHDNLRAALEWGLSHQPDAALQLAGTLVYFWNSGYVSEGCVWLQRALAADGTLPSAPEGITRARKAARAKALAGLGTLTFAMGSYQEAREALEQGLALAREIDDKRVLVTGVGIFAIIQSMQGDWKAALASAADGLAAAQSIGEKNFIGMIYGVMSRIAMFSQGDMEASDRYAGMSVRIAREVGNPFGLAMALGFMGYNSEFRGDLKAARAHFLESRALLNEIGNRQLANARQSEVAHLALREGDYAQAARLYRECIKVWHEMGQRGGLARCMECLAFIAAAQADTRRAARLLGAAEAIREASGMPMTSEEPPEYDRELAALRAQLDAAAFADAWAAGGALDEDQALALAFEEKGTT